MKRTILSAVLFCILGTTVTLAQNDYIVKTNTAENKDIVSDEEQFVHDNFPMRMLCDWVPGMKFMFMPEGRDIYVPIFRSYKTERDVDSGSLKAKTFEFIGTEEKSRELYIGTSYSTRFIFESDSVKYYYEVKMRLAEICVKDPRASISGLVYLNDVDVARELLIGKTFYTKASTARVDDSNSFTGWKEVNLPENTRVIITNVGVGSKLTPAKLIFENSKGNSFYMEVALSRTNSGMNIIDFQADKKMKYFANAFSLNDRNATTAKAIKKHYINMPIYPKRTIPVRGNFGTEETSGASVHLLRYTALRIKNIKVTPPSTLATIVLIDNNGSTYTVEADLKYNVILKNDNFFDDLFAFGDIRQKYPYVTEEDWRLIAMGEVSAGMTTDECRLALGNPAQIELKKDNRFESWIYPRKVLEFESGRLLRYK